jgi:hypothetical protein
MRTDALISRPWRRAALAALVVAVPLAGCGLGAGPVPSAVKLTVTSNFGARVLRVFNAPKLRGQETVMSLLLRNATVSTRYGGGFVQSIFGLSGGGFSSGQPVDWFYYVNGVEATKGAADTVVHPGDHIWWDRHDWSQTDDVPAVVGSFPEPFLNGIAGKRLPVRVECAVASSYPCRRVLIKLGDLGIPAALAAIAPGDEPESLRILVGPWNEVSGDSAAQSIERGPRASGVYARFSQQGATLTLLSERGTTARVLGSGAGLIAATRYAEEAPVWVITGTDEAGVRAAVQHFNQGTLENHFAVAFALRGAPVALPVSSSG